MFQVHCGVAKKVVKPPVYMFQVHCGLGKKVVKPPVYMFQVHCGVSKKVVQPVGPILSFLLNPVKHQAIVQGWGSLGQTSGSKHCISLGWRGRTGWGGCACFPVLGIDLKMEQHCCIFLYECLMLHTTTLLLITLSKIMGDCFQVVLLGLKWKLINIMNELVLHYIIDYLYNH